ncbi:alpha/beta fold hydrolase [Aeromonas diversa]|uniref:alpha/beta fold hydrolase n=1 Tax=Aeromonas diversa TaxID=502790 RepID=UPI0034637409
MKKNTLFLLLFPLLSACGGSDAPAQPAVTSPTPVVTAPTETPAVTPPASQPDTPTITPPTAQPDTPAETPPDAPAAPRVIRSDFTLEQACADVDELTCGFLEVPLDHHRPEGTRIEILYGVHKAEDPAQRIGTLMFNYGGPGLAGVSSLNSLLDGLPLEIRQRFDLVSFDPRGTGFSALGVALRTCQLTERPQDVSEQGVGEALYAQAEQWLGVMTGAFTREARTRHTLPQLEIVRRCAPVLDAYAPYLGSNSVVQDMELLRQHLGENALNFVGYSYGTRLGALYAERYPQHLRALILDSTMSPSQPDIDRVLLGQSSGWKTILEQRQPEATRQQLARIGETVLSQGVYVANDGARVDTRVWVPMLEQLISDEEGAERLRPMLDKLLQQDLGAELVAYMQSDRANSSAYRSALEDVMAYPLQAAVMCSDQGRDLTLAEIDALANDFEQSSIAGAKLHAMSYLCADWQRHRDPIPLLANLDQQLTEQQKVLIIGGSLDFATPLAWSRQMKAAFGPRAHLVEQQGVVHHGFSLDADYPCVTRIAVDYLLEPTSLPRESICQAP